MLTEVLGINAKGDLVGSYLDSADVVHGFVLSGGLFTRIDFPGAGHTAAYGINNRGQIVGRYVMSSNFFASSAQHSFVLSNGSFANVDPPGTTGRSLASSINNSGQIIGLFRDASGRHAYTASPTD